MFDVLVYLYENYWRPDACPEPDQLTRKLSAVGFDTDEIQDALRWLDGLARNAEACGEALTRDDGESEEAKPAKPARPLSTPNSIRVYTDAEQETLGEESIGFIAFLESAGVLPAPMREMVIDRAMATGAARVELDDLKVIVLMVFWSLGEEPDALVLDELFVAPEERVVH